MKKLAAALISSLFTTAVFAQASAPAATTTSNSATNMGLVQQPSAPGAAPRSKSRSTTHRLVSAEVHKHKLSHHTKKPFILDKSKLDAKSSLQ
ncbi:hypothetical protein [Burkholderia pseudomallei]|uniref:hypothetical protein n=1 Tax=Burkholderia pseudomallei TaxID=28450 RepID=UPI00016A95B7|nr:hypothetical protein [Burkholderia pseudomallei]AHE35118.1 hypothetical protein BBS_1135 [Burkholderia pseudomallei NAU20B-16]AHG33382.1 hypothetical protein BBQ_3069 [Burkholderia pseudomallei MSHR511]AHG67276.1 hypothetical protein BBN_3192 [Burkholderia pseudomallei MSHR146]AIS87976.1 hypothetical protein BBU_1785 [Burkholderia pseudomallei NAU35A-3]MBM5643800.1 hypothetical protein [Burkholderia pseudomallei]